MAMIEIHDDVRDELRKYKAEEGQTYTEAIQELLDENGYFEE